MTIISDSERHQIDITDPLIQVWQGRLYYNVHMKLCTRCKELKELNNFWFNKRRNFYRSECNRCHCSNTIRRRKVVGSRAWYTYQMTKLKNSAKRRKIDFNFSVDDFIAIKKLDICFYCGKSQIVKTIDRVNNTIGYSKNNCVMSCHKCNRLKAALTFSEISSLYLKMRAFF